MQTAAMTNQIQILKDQILPILQPYVSRIVLFGSMARGEADMGSDIDLLVVLKPSTQRPTLGLRWFALELELTQQLGRPVDMVTENALSPHVRPFIEQDQVVLYEEE